MKILTRYIIKVKIFLNTVLFLGESTVSFDKVWLWFMPQQLIYKIKVSHWNQEGYKLLSCFAYRHGLHSIGYTGLTLTTLLLLMRLRMLLVIVMSLHLKQQLINIDRDRQWTSNCSPTGAELLWFRLWLEVKINYDIWRSLGGELQ